MSALDAYITVPEAARRLGITRQAVHKLVQLGRVQADKIGRDWLIKEPALASQGNKIKRPPRRGFSLIEVALSIGLAGIALAAMEQGADDASRQIKDVAVADRLTEVYNAAVEYVKATPGLAASVPVGGSIELSVAKTTAAGAIPANSLQAGGFLPSTFVDVNSYGQNSAVIIRQPTSGNIEALVTTTGGDTIGDVDLGRVAAKVGADGGVVDSNPPPGVTAGTMLGVGGGWQEPASDWTTSGITPVAGHAVAVDYASQVNLLQDFLYRDNIGIHEANTMHTAIDMSANPINALSGINNINPTTGVSNGAISVGSNLQGPTAGSQLQVQNGVQACVAGTSGCQVALGTQTGLEDENDGWLSAYNTNASKGFHVQEIGGKGGALDVDAGSTLTGTVQTGAGVQMLNGGTITWPGAGGTASYLGPDSSLAGYLEVYGNLYVSGEVQSPYVYGSTVQGNYVNASTDMSAPIYYDSTNSAYYLKPASTSNLDDVYVNYLQSATTVEANTGGTRNNTDFYAYGFDVYEDGSGLTDETLDGALTVSGNATIGGNVSAGGSVTGDGVVTTLAANLGDGCSTAGEMAQDSGTGSEDWCKNGIWSSPAQQFNTPVAATQSIPIAGEAATGTNPAAYEATTITQTIPVGTPYLVSAITSNTCLQYGISLSANVNGQSIGGAQGYNGIVTFIVPSGGSYALTETITADTVSPTCLPGFGVYQSIWK